MNQRLGSSIFGVSTPRSFNVIQVNMRKAPSTAFTLLGILLLSIGPSVAACGSNGSDSNGGTNTDGGLGNPEFGDGGIDTDAGDPYANDPAPPWCGPSNVPAPPPIGGTPDCPDDKNKPGCPCKNVGETAACWTGLRANRGLGQCKDGKATCESKGELNKVWGACQGEVLPVKGATKGKEACKCFSAGQWKIDNLIPCYANDNGTFFATSATCNGSVPPKTVPATPWSSDTVTVDCAGHFKLCYSIKVGDAKNPQPSDCTITTVCTEGDYLEANKPQKFPDLGGWVSPPGASTCVQKIMDQTTPAPTYGEMTVIGKSVRCDDISDNGQPYVFNRVPYCLLGCQPGSSDPKCAGCQATGSGNF